MVTHFFRKPLSCVPLQPHGPMRDFKQLLAWQKAYQFVVRLHEISKEYPPEEQPLMVTQLVRTAIRIAGKTAASCAFPQQKHRCVMLAVPIAAADEAESHIVIGELLGHFRPAEHDDLLVRIHEITRLLLELQKPMGTPG